MNLRRFVYRAATNTVEIGTQDLREINDFVRNERLRNQADKLWVFVIGSTIRISDFRETPIPQILNEAEGIVVNVLDDADVPGSIMLKQYMSWPPRYVLMAESASVLFRKLRMPEAAA